MTAWLQEREILLIPGSEPWLILILAFAAGVVLGNLAGSHRPKSATLGTIADGVPNPKNYRSPMPPMGGAQLSPSQVSAVASYVWALSHREKGG